MRPSRRAFRNATIASFHFRTFVRGRKKGAAATIRINEQLPSLREMTAHPRTYHPLKTAFEPSAARWSASQKDDEKRESIGTKVATARTIEISSGWRIDIGKTIPFLPFGTIATIPSWMMMTRPTESRQGSQPAAGAAAAAAGSGFWEIERQRGPRRLGPTMMDEESFREEEW